MANRLISAEPEIPSAIRKADNGAVSHRLMSVIRIESLLKLYGYAQGFFAHGTADYRRGSLRSYFRAAKRVAVALGKKVHER